MSMSNVALLNQWRGLGTHDMYRIHDQRVMYRDVYAKYCRRKM